MDRKQKKIVILLFTLLISSSVHAQMEKELAGVDFVRLGSDNSANSVRFDKYSIRFAMPLSLKKEGSLLISKFEYAQTNIDYPFVDVNLDELERFHTISYSVGYMRKLKNNWGPDGDGLPEDFIEFNFFSSMERCSINGDVNIYKKSKSQYESSNWSHVFRDNRNTSTFTHV
ncbi:hypothetical protein DF185_05725 [Marinifilum breve]|uniref:Uncharacterized protein n=1 Tax=Marinifilum breve TaxID=2184082 RepID=A0A2V4A0V1_9BACT|nr:hypothetical protein DF185_05725 [Marinifilum breve]